ncbi:hypothetical protein [Streptomyces microflavus]
MSDWSVEVPERLYEEFARLSGPGRRAVHEALAQLARDPRDPQSSAEPITGAELRRITTRPTADTGDRITLLYRVHTDDAQPGRIEIIYVISGP